MPYTHNEVIKLGQDIKEATSEHTMNKVCSDKVCRNGSKFEKQIKERIISE